MRLLAIKYFLSQEFFFFFFKFKYLNDLAIAFSSDLVGAPARCGSQSRKAAEWGGTRGSPRRATVIHPCLDLVSRARTSGPRERTVSREIRETAQTGECLLYHTAPAPIISLQNGLEFSVGADLEGRTKIRHRKFGGWPDRCGV